jgi:hypothetical protein
MAKFTATIEQAGDGSWTTLAVIGEHSILGNGNTKEETIESLRKGVVSLVEYLKSKGKTLPEVVDVR